VAGYTYNGANYDFVVARYRPDGSLDPSFDGDGIVVSPIGTTYDSAYGVVVQPDGSAHPACPRSLLKKVIAEMGPLPGAADFLDWLRERFQVVILSDTFYEFAKPLMKQLGLPTLFCHSLEANAEGILVNYHLRMPDQKREAVKRFKELNFKVAAAGDSYNDTGMLAAADAGFFIHPPESIVAQFPQFPLRDPHLHLQGVQAPLRLAQEHSRNASEQHHGAENAQRDGVGIPAGHQAASTFSSTMRPSNRWMFLSAYRA